MEDLMRPEDDLTRWLGVRWEEAPTLRVTIRPELLNRAGMLSGVVAYTLVDYSMGSVVWATVNDGEGIATTNIAVNYLRTAREGDIVCRSVLDRRTRSNAGTRSEVVHEATGDVLLTAIGTYAVFPRRPG
jgi:uncharacterized protein (TIGR00369 family)